MQKPRTTLADAVLAIEGSQRTTNERGNEVTTAFLEDISRDTFDSKIRRGGKGWQQWDTEHDFAYFGVWVHRGLRQVLTLAEGDISVVKCPDDEHFAAELTSMERLYGAPPAAIGIDKDGAVTKYFSSRLTAAGLRSIFMLVLTLVGGCHRQPIQHPAPAEITDLVCGRSCMVTQSGPSTIIWIDGR